MKTKTDNSVKDQNAPCDNNMLGDDFLDLNKIVAYLPYELRLFNKKNCQIETLKALNESGTLYTGSFFNDWNHIYNFKPILRPLSDLTKEIEVNGKKFVPIEILNKMLFTKHSKLEYYDSEFCNGAILFSTNIAGFNILSINEKIQKLLEWHFDIYGLIKKSLAISIHDVEQVVD